MAEKRTRILYASQSVRANGHLLYRVQTLGCNTTFTNEDVFELGHLDIVDVVDDVPAVAVALDTNEFGGVDNGAILAGMNPLRMTGEPTTSGAYLRALSTCNSDSTRYYHGYSLADFTLGQGCKIAAPVQNEVSLGTLDDDIQMTLFMDKVYVNSITLTYNVGATATENYAAETDNKMWLVNGAKYVTTEEWDDLWSITAASTYNIALNDSTHSIPELSNCKLAFLCYTDEGKAGVLVKGYDERYGAVYEVSDSGAGTNIFGWDATNKVLTAPTNAATLFPVTSAPYKITAVYAANAYGATGQNTAGAGTDSTRIFAKYFELISSSSDPSNPAAHYPEEVGAVRQGQIEVYLVDPDTSYTGNTDWDMLLRMQTVTITATPTRTPLNELGHLRYYARPINFPVEITTATTATASDLELWAKFSGLTASDYEDGGSATDAALTHLMSKENLHLVVKIFQQTDEEAGGSGMSRTAQLDSLIGQEYYDWDGYDTYSAVGCTDPDRERPLKTVIVPNLKITAENFNNAVGGGGAGGAGATQEFNFRSTNELYVVKGDVHIWDVECMERNPGAHQF